MLYESVNRKQAVKFRGHFTLLRSNNSDNVGTIGASPEHWTEVFPEIKAAEELFQTGWFSLFREGEMEARQRWKDLRRMETAKQNSGLKEDSILRRTVFVFLALVRESFDHVMENIGHDSRRQEFQ